MAGYVVPSENKQHKDPGVPSKARIESFFITPKIKFQAGKPQPYPEGGKGVMALATARPKPLDASKLLDLTNPVLSPAGIVANLGMTLADERAWAKFLDDEAVKAVNEVAFRKVVMEHAVEEKLDAALRRAIAQRALVYWRGLVVEKALYIGPRGGKWADPQHTIPWDPKKHAPGRKIHVIDMTAVPGPKPKKQIGLFDKPPTKILGEEGAAGTKEPVKPRPTPAPGPGPALIVPRGTKKREKAVEVGEHVWGSRADLAVRSADDLKELSPEDQAKFATKKNLMPTRDVDELLEADFTPASIVLRRAIESCVQSKAPNSLLERQDYMNGIDFLSRSLDGCMVGQGVEDFLIDWMNLQTGKKRDKTYSADDMEAIRKEYLEAHGIRQTLSIEELGAVRTEETKTWGELRLADIAKMPKSEKKYKQLTERFHELRKKIEVAAKAFPQPHSLLKWKLDIPRYGGLSLGHGRDGSVTTYMETPELAVGDNPYQSMAKALGPRMVNLVDSGGIYRTTSGKGEVPKVYKDAKRVARDMQGGSPEKQLETLRAVTGTKGGQPRIRRPPYRWERDVPGEIDRVGGKPITTADPQALAKDFGFKNVQFGHWVTEEDADTHLRGAHGALFDLADILGVDPKAVGLNGRLSLGIGARGSGSARAHYEPGKQIINITKIAGGGSLAHEWAHALDNIIAVASDPKATRASMYLSGGAVTGVDRAVTDALDEVMAAIRWGGNAEVLKLEQRAKDLLVRRKAKKRLTYSERRELRNYQAAMTGRTRVAVRSRFMEDAQAIGGKGQNAYWSRPHEMFARAFESYIEDTLEAGGRRSSYLVSGTTKRYPSGREAGTEKRDAQPYPQGAERVAINTAMSGLMRVIASTKSLEKALLVLDGGEVRYVIDLAKAQARGGKYHRRVPKPGGGFHYIYDPEQYGARRDAHLDGDDAGRTYLSGKIDKCLEGAGQKGCGPKVFQSLVKRHGAKRVAQTLRDGIKNGTLAYRAGRFYGMKEKS